MIISCVSDEALQAAVRRVAAPDEDVIESPAGSLAVSKGGFPRAVVRQNRRPVYEPVRFKPGGYGDLPAVVITAGTLSRWRFEHRRGQTREDFTAFLTGRLRPVVSDAPRIPWVEGIFRTLERAAGASLPRAFRGFARRVLEHPVHYAALSTLSERLGLTAGALQGRFLRRGLNSPSDHLRWLRLLAVAEGLGDPGVTVGAASELYGYTSAGNLCRSMQTISGRSPTELRDAIVRLELGTQFALRFLHEDARRAWGGLDDLFWGVPPVEADARGLSA